MRILIFLFGAYFIYKRLRSILNTTSTHKTSGRTSQERQTGGQKKKHDSGFKNSRSQKRSPYEVLGVTPRSSREEVKRAYHELMAKYHPDKVAHLGEELQVLAKEKSQEIVQAYREVSSD